MFKAGEIDITIEGVSIKPVKQNTDSRGWLAEVYRLDEVDGYKPEMSYISMTYPNIVRGPHEHMEQTDYFCFLGSFTLYLWDNRKGSSTYGNKMVIEKADRMVAVVPPGVVHAYKNSGDTDGMVLNFPDKLFAGWGKKEKVDEVRYENNPESPFRIES